MRGSDGFTDVVQFHRIDGTVRASLPIFAVSDSKTEVMMVRWCVVMVMAMAMAMAMVMMIGMVMVMVLALVLVMIIGMVMVIGIMRSYRRHCHKFIADINVSNLQSQSSRIIMK